MGSEIISLDALDEIKKNALKMKSIADATILRNHVLFQEIGKCALL
jgi:hypothetical protein